MAEVTLTAHFVVKLASVQVEPPAEPKKRIELSDLTTEQLERVKAKHGKRKG